MVLAESAERGVFDEPGSKGSKTHFDLLAIAFSFASRGEKWGRRRKDLAEASKGEVTSEMYSYAEMRFPSIRAKDVPW